MSDIIIEQQNRSIIIQTTGSGSGGDGRGITSVEIVDGQLIVTYTDSTIEDAGAVTAIVEMDIVGNDLVVTYNNGEIVNLGRVVGANGTNGTNGTDGNGITAITQPSSLVMRVATRDLAPVDITLLQGPQGNTGAAGADGPSSLLPFINKQSFIDHLMPAATGTGIAVNFQALVRSGSGTAAFRNTHTIGGGGQITLNTGGAGSTDLAIRRGAGLSGGRVGTTPIDYIFCFYADTLQNSGDSSVFRLCAQNDNTATIVPSNRTGFYVDFAWQTDGVKATFSCFNNTVSTVVTDSLALASGTLYAVRVRVSSTTAQLFINGVLRQTINTNLPVFAPIQMSVALSRTGSGAGASYTVDALASEVSASQNIYTL